MLALAVLVIGYAYDLWFKGTAWSWLPFAAGIPLLPVFGWLGTTGRLPGVFAMLVPVAVVGGAALAIANARADAERDAAAGTDSVAVRLGPGRAWAVNAGLVTAVILAAVGTLLGRKPTVVRPTRGRCVGEHRRDRGRAARTRPPAAPGSNGRGNSRRSVSAASRRAGWRAPASEASSPRRRSGRSRWRSRAGASRSSGTSRGSRDRSGRSTRGAPGCSGRRRGCRRLLRGSAWR